MSLGGGRWGHVDVEVVQLDVDEMNRNRLSRAARMGVIAHEMAHLFLGHLDQQGISDDEAEKAEREADQKAVEWGFQNEINAIRRARKRLGLSATLG